jgi:nucleotide-binding universal stress UspA family protein
MSDTVQHQYTIVVGFDGSEGARRAVVWGADEARQRAAKLEIVRAWTPGEFGTDEEQGLLAHKAMDEDVESLLGEPTGDRVTVAEQGHAAKVLLNRARRADMLVVGSRGRGGFVRMLLGSVGHQIAIHDSVSVVVIVRR